MKITNKHNLPQAIVNFAHRNEYNPGKSDITVSRLIDSPRIAALSKQHYNQLETDIHDLIPALLGTALHSIFEKGADKKNIPEERLFTTILGWRLSGQIDSQIIEDDGIIIEDYKSTSAYAVMMEKADWERQVNCYAYLVGVNKSLPVKAARIIALVRDWKRHEVGKEGYPETQIVTIPVRLWSKEEQFAYICQRLDLHANTDAAMTMGGEIGKCSPEEQWRKGETYAVHRAKNLDRAWRVFDRKEDAEAFAAQQKDVVIVTRKAIATRCENYCKVSGFCDQYMAEKEVTNEVQ